MKFNAVNDDLFNAPKDNVFVECVSSDLEMGKGIAVEFNAHFNAKNRAKRQCKEAPEVGTCVWLEDQTPDDTSVCLLITKDHYYDKPTQTDFFNSLKSLGRTLNDNNVSTPIAMPMIGTGLDRLPVSFVLDSIYSVFNKTDYEINMYTPNTLTYGYIKKYMSC